MKPPPVVFDTETVLFRPGVMAPELVCVTWRHDGREGIAHWSEALPLLKWIWAQPRIVGHSVSFDAAVTGANFPQLLPDVFRAYDEGRVECTQVREQLLNIRKGTFRGYTTHEGKKVVPTYQLATLTAKYFGRDISASKADDAWRMKYGTLMHLPISAWPKDAIEYPLEDVRLTEAIFLAQDYEIAKPVNGIEYGELAHSTAKASVAFVARLMSNWGLRTAPHTVANLAERTEDGLQLLAAQLGEVYTHLPASAPEGTRAVHGPSGYVCKFTGGAWTYEEPYLGGATLERRPPLVRPNGTRDTKAAEAYALEADRMEREEWEEIWGRGTYKSKIRMTAGGKKPKKDGTISPPKVSLSGPALADLAEDYPLLGAYAEFGELRSVLAKDVKALRDGILYPIHSRFGDAESDRLTSSKPNVQNWRTYPGIRECFVPREGWCFIQADYSGLELSTLAEVCRTLFGRSALADAIRAKRDPHLIVAAELMRTDYATAELAYYDKTHPLHDKAKEFRKMAKPVNFGFPGGLGIAKFVLFAKLQYKVELTDERALELRDIWFKLFPEMREFFAYVRSLRKCDNGGYDYWVREIVTNRIRGGCNYTAACNDHFQALGASMTQRALYEISRECYVVPSSALYGSRPVNYVHDEFFVESPIPRAHDAAMRLRDVAEDVARRFMPYAPPACPPALLMRMSKAGHEMKDDAGRLVPWDVHTCQCNDCEKLRKALDGLVRAA
jgi:hypothetical protein